MVTTFNATEEGVRYEFTGFVLLEGDGTDKGYRWLLELPTETFDQTVDIVDGDTTYRFTDAELVPTRGDTAVERVIRAVERTEQ